MISPIKCAVAQGPQAAATRLLITSDGAGASHDLIDWCQRQNHAADRSVQYSIGFEVDADVGAAIGRVPTNRWQASLDATLNQAEPATLPYQHVAGSCTTSASAGYAYPARGPGRTP